MSEAKHTPGPWRVGFSDESGPSYITGPGDVVVVGGSTDDWGVTQGARNPADAARIVLCCNAHDELLSIVQYLALATDEGDDAARGTHYIAKDGVIRCKGSFLTLIERARAALTKAAGDAS